MMLRSKLILLIIMLFVEAQLVVSQSVCDSVKVDSIVPQSVDTLAIDTLELADAEFEAWLDEYANVKEVVDTAVRDTVEKRDFVGLVAEGEEARMREKNALISSVLSSIKNRVSSDEVKCDTVVSEQLEVLEDLGKLELPDFSTFASSGFLIAEVDSQLATCNSQHSTQVNPLFMDWVLVGIGGKEQGVGSREYGIWSEDSIVAEVRKDVKDYIRTTAPELYTYHKSDLPAIGELQTSHITHADKEKLLLNLDTLNKNKTSQLKVDLPAISLWSKGAKFQVHASQNYISQNWYKGGESNMAMTMYAMGYFNYNNRRGLQWDNKVEWKLGLYGMSSDSLRWLHVNEDLLRLNSKLGYKAFKNFYYTAEWDVQTSLFNTYKSNTHVRASGPFSPIRMSLSAGMDYKWKSMVSVFVSPLSYKLIYVADMRTKDGVSETENIAYQVGITDGTRRSNQLGALIRTDFDYDFNESIGMEVHFSFFGNYAGKIKGVEVGCEVIGNFKINRFLSAKVSLYPRYDSTTVPADGGKPKLQFYELISLGFNYKL
ncbi:MAG: DUF3078 domain-containing protein [Paludibacteraceae bacterium]|nr:DUF3078 domain-containing protein [Paludibacteraceae bacterium]